MRTVTMKVALRRLALRAGMIALLFGVVAAQVHGWRASFGWGACAMWAMIWAFDVWDIVKSSRAVQS
jgi:hypothetical protein